MNEPTRMPDLSPFYRRRPGMRSFRNRPGVHDSIENARSTLLINLIIEILAGLIFITGIFLTIRFLFARRAVLDPARFKLYIEIIIFFTVGWFTYVGFKIRTKFLLLKKNWNPDKSVESDRENTSV